MEGKATPPGGAVDAGSPSGSAQEPGRGLGWGSALRWVLGIGLLLALVLLLGETVGWRALLEPWGKIPPTALGSASLLVLGSYLLRTARVHRYFLPDTRGRFLPAFRVMLLHNLFNNLLPARTGEASFPILMKRELGVPVVRSLPALLYLRVLDLHTVLLLGTAVLLVPRGLPGWLGLALVAPLPWLAFRGQSWLGRRIGAPGGRLRRMVATGLAGLPGSSSLFWSIWGWTAVNWAAKLLVFAWVLRAFHPLPYSTALLGSVTGELSSILPVHGVAGAGTYEAGVLVALLPMGIDATEALAAAVNLHLFVLGVSILSAFLALLLPRGGGSRPLPVPGGPRPEGPGGAR